MLPCTPPEVRCAARMPQHAGLTSTRSSTVQGSSLVDYCPAHAPGAGGDQPSTQPSAQPQRAAQPERREEQRGMQCMRYWLLLLICSHRLHPCTPHSHTRSPLPSPAHHFPPASVPSSSQAKPHTTTRLRQAATGAGGPRWHGLSAGGCGGGDDHRHNLQLQSGGSSHDVGGLWEEGGRG